jgi:hypothetical protein
MALEVFKTSHSTNLPQHLKSITDNRVGGGGKRGTERERRYAKIHKISILHKNHFSKFVISVKLHHQKSWSSGQKLEH